MHYYSLSLQHRRILYSRLRLRALDLAPLRLVVIVAAVQRDLRRPVRIVLCRPVRARVSTPPLPLHLVVLPCSFVSPWGVCIFVKGWANRVGRFQNVADGGDVSLRDNSCSFCPWFVVSVSYNTVDQPV